MIDHRTAAYGLFVLRVALGVLALSHGLTKLLVFTPAGTVGFVGSLGYPAAAAWYAMVVETLGGVVLILGLYARVAALLQLPIQVDIVPVANDAGQAVGIAPGEVVQRQPRRIARISRKERQAPVRERAVGPEHAR